VVTAQATTTTAKNAAALRAALLTAADVPGTIPGPAAKETDLGPCFAGNPVSVKSNPNEVVGPSLGIVQGRVRRSFESNATEAGPKQAAAYVATFSSPAGSACVIDAIKKAISSQSGPKADASGMAGSVKAVAIADGGAVLAVKGSVKVNGAPAPAALDLVVFRKGQVVVLVSAGAFGGTTTPNQAVELARKVNGRLP